VPENIQAAMYILKKIATQVNVPFIIAGKDPNKMIITEAKKLKNVSLVMNPTDGNLYDLIKNAHINLLLTFQSTGIKLKLLNALHRGRFCMVNTPMIEQTGLEELCFIENDAQSQIDAIKKQMNITFTEQDRASRMQLLSNKFSNHENATNMAKAIWKEK
jgi:hypothetical protein